MSRGSFWRSASIVTTTAPRADLNPAPSLEPPEVGLVLARVRPWRDHPLPLQKRRLVGRGEQAEEEAVRDPPGTKAHGRGEVDDRQLALTAQEDVFPAPQVVVNHAS